MAIAVTLDAKPHACPWQDYSTITSERWSGFGSQMLVALGLVGLAIEHALDRLPLLLGGLGHGYSPI